MMKKKGIFILCLFCQVILSFAEVDSLANRLYKIFPQDVADQLISKEKLEIVRYKKNSNFTYYPRTTLGEEAIKTWAKNKLSLFSIEALYLFKKQESTVPGADINRISKLLQSISSFEKIKYYSSKRDRVGSLYDFSYAIDNPTSKNRIPDPINENADKQLTYAYQLDWVFDDNVYEYYYRQTDTEVSFFSKNYNDLKYSFIRVIKSGELQMTFVIDDLGDVLVIYGLIQADYFNFPGVQSRVKDSFSYRAEGVFNWFLEEYNE